MSDLERRLADALKGVSERHLEEAPHRPGAVQQQVIQRVRRRWGTFVVTTSAVAALVLALAAVSVPRLLSGREDGPGDVAQTALVPATTTFEIGEDPVAIAADDQAVWVALRGGFLQRIDAASNTDITGIGVAATTLTDVAVGAGQVWASGTLTPGHVRTESPEAKNVLYKIESDGLGYEIHPLEEPQRSLAVTANSVWAISEEANPEGGTLNRFTFDAGGGNQAGISGSESTEWVPEGIVADGESIWTVGTDSGYVVRELDGVTGEVRHEVRLDEPLPESREPWQRPDITSPIATGNGSVVATWWTRERIAQFDQVTGTILHIGHEIEGVKLEFGAMRAVAISGGEAWVVIDNDRVARMDLESGEFIGEPIEVGSDPVDIAAGAGAVWTINRGDGTVTRIDLVQPAPDQETTEDEPSPVQPTPTQPTSPTPDSDDLSEELQIDAQMSELLDVAGAPCRSFDFQLKEEIEGHLYRPAYCKDQTQNTVLLFSFATKEDRQAWVDAGRPSKFSLKKGSPIVVGLTWEAHAIDLQLARKVGEKLEGEVIQSQE